MNSNRSASSTWLTGIALLTIALSLALQAGCAVLTGAQVKEVDRFAKATNDYGTLPGTALRAYVEASRMRRTLTAANIDDPSTAWDSLRGAEQFTAKVNSLASRADAALSVLDKYSELLQRLASDSYTESLDESTQKLGEELDKAIALANQYRTDDPLPSSIGGIAAAIVRGAGGLFIRHEQLKALRGAVTDGDRVIIEMTTDIELLMDELASTAATSLKLIENERQDLETNFPGPWQDSSRDQRRELSRQMLETLIDLRQAEDLSQKAKRAAQKYREAHMALAENVKKRNTEITDVKTQIDAMRIELEAAWKVRSKISEG